jgi:dipeptidyl-peptidase-3
MSVPAYIVPRKVPYFPLYIRDAFKTLNKTERLYAHHLNSAGWHATTVCASQVSTESPAILRFLFSLFDQNSQAQLREAAVKDSVSADDFDKFVEYAALLYANMGNYKSFGDSKFIPACDRAVFTKIVESAPNDKDAILRQYEQIADKIFSVSAGELGLGFPPNGTSSYYSPDITKEEIDAVDAFLTSKGMECWNTRVWKSGDQHYTVRIPCSVQSTETFKTAAGLTIDIARGDFAAQFSAVVNELQQARQYAANDVQREMLDAYVKHFENGDINDHKAAQVAWVKDKGPTVESNIGFIETYRDPQGVRAEWEGFVAIVDKEQSRKFGQLVSRGPEFIAQLPWGKAFEKEEFKEPDFTSLEVLGFASTGVPLGICIPNYDDIRQNIGFKNVILGNAVSAMNFDDKINHVTDSDWELYRRHFIDTSSMLIGLHELLGHGTGKLFSVDAEGKPNFEKGTVVNTLTGQPVTSWYKPGETWGSVFGGISNAYEECRAEGVALYLCLQREIAAIFNRGGEQEHREAVHLGWLNMVRGGMIGLEHYAPETKQWRQAHARARYCILQVLYRGANPIVKIDHDPATNKLFITVDADRIATDGRTAIGELLCNLNINKATANVAAGKAYFEDLTAVGEEFEQIRETIVRVRKPRREFVQAHTRVNTETGDVDLLEFEGSATGVVDSFVARHRDIAL